MKKFIFSLILLIIISTNILANEEKYSKENCKKIYDAIGTFLYLAHVEWEKKTEEGGKKDYFILKQLPTIQLFTILFVNNL